MAKKIVVVLVILGLAAGALYYWWWLPRHEQKQDQNITLYGNVDIRQVQLAFNASGRVVDMPFFEGDRVEKGQVVARLDDERYKANLAAARALTEAKEQFLAKLEAGTRPEEIAQARANLDGAQARYEDTAKLYRRQQVLAKSKSLAQQQLDNTRSNYQAAKAAVEAARQALALAIKGPRAEDVDAARAEVHAAQAQTALAQVELDDAVLKAPAVGVVQARILEPGDMASPQQAVYTLALTNPLWVRAFVEENELGKVTPGMKAYVTTDSFPKKRYQGWVGFVSPTAEFTPKRVETAELRTKLVYRVKVVVCNPGGELRLGMPVTVVIPQDQPRPADGRPDPQPCTEN